MQTNGTGYTILALAPFDTGSEAKSQAPLAVSRDTLDQVMAALDIRYYLPLESGLCPAGGIELRFDSVKSLHPDGMVGDNDYLNQLMEAGHFLKEARRQGQSPGQIAEGLRRWPDLPDVDLPSAPEKTSGQAPVDGSGIDHILQMVALPGTSSSGAIPADTNPLAEIPARIVGTLLQRPDFRRLEAAWRGLRLLLMQGALDERVRISIAPLHAETFDGQLKTLSTHVLAEPPSLVTVDLPFDNTPLAIERLHTLAIWADALMIPVLAWVPPEFLQIAGWEELPTLPYLLHHLDSGSYAKYRRLRQAPEGRWMCLSCNRFLIRYPYGPDNTPRRIALNETLPLWIAPVWGLAAVIAQSVCKTGWPTRFMERDRVQLQDLAFADTSRTLPLVVDFNPSADRRAQFLEIGISPLATEPGRDRAFFADAVTLSGAGLKYQLMVSLVTQFVVWCRDNLPVEKNAADIEMQLRLAFQVFSERSQPPGLSAVKIEVGAPDEHGRFPVRIVAAPTTGLIAPQEPIELQLNW